MAEQPNSRPILIPPLSKQSGHLEVVRERPQAHRTVEHPHCTEHFLFTPHCAACLEAERIGTASAHATPTASKPKAVKPAAKSSRSFGFTDNIPYSLLHEPTYLEQMARSASNEIEGDIVGAIVDGILDL